MVRVARPLLPSTCADIVSVQTAAIWDEKEFAALESRAAEIFAAIQTPSTNFAGRSQATRSPAQDLLLSVIAGSIGVKAHIVTVDEREDRYAVQISISCERDERGGGHTVTEGYQKGS